MNREQEMPTLVSRRDCCFSAGRVLLVSVTDICNQACVHCMRDARFGGRVSRMAPEFEAWISDAVRWAAPTRVVVSGGEPTMVVDLAQAVEIIHRHVNRISLCTNALRVTKSVARGLADAGLSAATVGLDGVGSTYEEFRRSPSGFGRAFLGIEALAWAGVDVTINITLSNSTISEAGTFAKALRHLPVSAFCVTSPMAAGQASRNITTFDQLRHEDVVGFAEELSRSVDVPVQLRVPRCDRDCGSGREVFSMTKNGARGVCLDKGKTNVIDLPARNREAVEPFPC